jgi:dihydroorotase-like cyclic amidohydrolase
MKVFPPIRTARDRDALVDGLAQGVITVVATDHAPHTDEEKAGSFDAAPSGTPGVQTLYCSSLELASRLGDVWLAPRWVAEAPAAMAGLQESKGTIAPGFDADIALIAPSQPTRVRPEEMRSRQRHGALEGMEFRFSVRATYVRGAAVTARTRPGGRLVRPTKR